MTRPPEHLVHGLDGPVMIVTARVAAYLLRYAGLDEFYREHRGADAEVDAALAALRLTAWQWQKTVPGTTPAPSPEPPSNSKWLSTGAAAGLLGISDRAVRRAIAEGRLRAEQTGGRWYINRIDIEHYKAGRTR